MANAVISRSGGSAPSVTLPLRDIGKSLAVARDVGKPKVKFHKVGLEDPLPQDFFSAADTWTVTGRLDGASAFADAQKLAEDIIKPQLGDSDELTLDLSDLPNHSTYEVVPNTDAACTVEYAPGRRQAVDVQLTLQAVNDTVSAGGQTAQATQSPDAGSGVKLTDGSNPVTITENLRVTRTVGRPAYDLVQQPATLPIAFDLIAPAVDVFEISGSLESATAEADAQTLEETLIRARQGTGSLTLHFLGNEYGLDAYDVMPESASALRTTFSTGETGRVGIARLTLRVVDTTTGD